VVLAGNLTEHLATDRIELAITPEEAHHPFGLLKRLDGRVQQEAVEATILESNVMLVILVKGVHGFLPWIGISEGYPVDALRARLQNSGLRIVP
jgi:hypothetical protein